WASRVHRVMRRRKWGPVQVVARTDAAGLVGVSIERGVGGLDVVSVIAAPDVPPMRVIAAAYDVAAGVAGLPSADAFIPAFVLALEGPTWAVRERVLEDHRGPERIERSEVTIPAWTAKTVLSGLISAKGTGFAEAVRAVLEQLPPDPRGDRADAVQTARA